MSFSGPTHSRPILSGFTAGRYCLLALVLSALAATGGQVLFCRELHLKELIYGGFLTYGNALLALLIAGRAIGRETTGFLFWGLLMNGLRAGLLASLIVVAYRLEALQLSPFLAATLTGYFVTLFVEIGVIHSASLRLYKSND